MSKICSTCEGTGRVVGEDGIGFRPSRSDHEEADECADCGGTGYRHHLPFHDETMAGLKSLSIREETDKERADRAREERAWMEREYRKAGERLS